MSLVRRAIPEDAEELLRLRQVMIDSMAGADTSTDWHAESLATVRGRLAEPDGGFAAFVVDHPERVGALGALVVGTLEYRIGRAGNPHGRIGYAASILTAGQRGLVAPTRRSRTCHSPAPLTGPVGSSACLWKVSP